MDAGNGGMRSSSLEVDLVYDLQLRTLAREAIRKRGCQVEVSMLTDVSNSQALVNAEPMKAGQQSGTR
jgi:hypothetical protein